MQHPDEGMIHSWLDGALSAEEAARVESHVGECATCAAAVAEARGFIAASSRILTALDNVPRGVLPAVPAKRRDFRIVWRAAAAVLVVAGGSFVVMRDGGPDAGVSTRSEATAVSALDQATVAATSPAPATGTGESTRAAESGASANAATTRPALTVPPRSSPRRSEPGRQSGLTVGADRAIAKAPTEEAAGALGAAVIVTAPSALRMQMNEAAPDSDAAPLKVLRMERTAGSRLTIYEVAPSETVTLTEPEGDSTAAARIMLRENASVAASRQRESRATNAAAPMSAEAAEAPPPPAATMDSKAALAFTAAPNTIIWTEPRTGKKLTLSGNVSVARLQEIRKRIETERAARRAN